MNGAHDSFFFAVRVKTSYSARCRSILVGTTVHLAPSHAAHVRRTRGHAHAQSEIGICGRNTV